MHEQTEPVIRTDLPAGAFVRVQVETGGDICTRTLSRPWQNPLGVWVVLISAVSGGHVFTGSDHDVLPTRLSRVRAYDLDEPLDAPDPTPTDEIPDKHGELHFATLDNMERTGGGFVQALAVAWRKADRPNHAKLWHAFADYHRQYQPKG